MSRINAILKYTLEKNSVKLREEINKELAERVELEMEALREEVANELFNEDYEDLDEAHYKYKEDKMGHYEIKDTKSGKSVYLQGDDAREFEKDIEKAKTQRQEQDIMSQYSDVMEDYDLNEADGWIAFYNGKKLEITKDKADSIYAAKVYAAKELKVPKSKMGLLAIKPGYNEEVDLDESDNELEKLEKEYEKLQDIMDKVVEKGGNPKNTSTYKKSKDIYAKIRKLRETSDLDEAKMSNSEILAAAKKLAKNGKDTKTKNFGQGLVDFYKENESFTPDQVAGLQNIMKNAGFQMAKE